MQIYAYVILAAGWILWLAPFVVAVLRQRSGPPQVVDVRARIGMVFQAFGYSLLWQAKFWEKPVTDVRLALAALFFVLAILLSWTAPRALAAQWRMDAGLNADHQLVRVGPYRYVRHPIYTSMLCVMFATGLMIAPVLLFAPAVVLFLIGTEIRVRVEDRLLESRFGLEFLAYRGSVSAFIPFLK